MGLIQKQVTSAVAAANQANSQKSTGPQSVRQKAFEPKCLHTPGLCQGDCCQHEGAR
jgi:hypothetical protein